MRASIETVQKVLQCSPPQHIWQKAFDYDDSHLYNLLKHVPGPWGKPPSHADLIDYTLDVQYETIQPDLFCCLFPLCLEAWRLHLLAPSTSHYGGFVDYFFGALASRSFLVDLLNREEYETVVKFMQDSILDRMDQEESLSFPGRRPTVYDWFYTLSSFAVIFPFLKPLWDEWWSMKTAGHAIAVLQYISCLMYVEDENPIFRPWTHEHGGGPPVLWETEGFIYNRGWQPENVSFVQATLTMDYVENKLQQAALLLQGHQDSIIAEQMIRGFDTQRDILAYRLGVLPRILGSTELDDTQKMVIWGWLYYNFPGESG